MIEKWFSKLSINILKLFNIFKESPNAINDLSYKPKMNIILITENKHKKKQFGDF